MIEESLLDFIQTEVPDAGYGYPLQVPQDASFPAWAYTVISDEEILSHGGRTGLAKARVQIDFMAQEDGGESDYAVVKGIANAARNALDGYKGNMGSMAVDYCHVELTDDWADVHKLPVQRFDVLLMYHR